MDWLKASACEQGRAIMAGLLDPVDQTEGYLDAIARNPYADRIYARLTQIRARAEAISAHDRARSGLRRGLLDGVALSWKDNIDTAGIATEAGSRLLEGRVPAEDADILQNAKLGGGVCLGKTHMTELAFSGLGINTQTETPPNSFDAAKCPGGSSSGAAVSVAMGLAAAAIGSDTGGSIRTPSAWNDLVGFKPTHGVVRMRGVVPLCNRFDVAGPLARTVEDCAELAALITGRRSPDLIGVDIHRLRLLVLDGLPFDKADSAQLRGFEDAVARIARAGAAIAHAEPDAAARALETGTPLYAAEAYGLWRAQIEDAPELMAPPILERFRGGKAMLAHDYVALEQAMLKARQDWAKAVEGFDAVLLPTVAILPPDIARCVEDERYFTERNMLALRNCRIGNVLGLPAITLPTGLPACGIMLFGQAGADARLLRTAATLEAALR